MEVGPEDVQEFLHEPSPGESSPDSLLAAAAHHSPALAIGEQVEHGRRHRACVDVGNANPGVSEHFRCSAGIHESHDRQAALHRLHVDERARILARRQREQIGSHVVRSHRASRPDEPNPVSQAADSGVVQQPARAGSRRRNGRPRRTRYDGNSPLTSWSSKTLRATLTNRSAPFSGRRSRSRVQFLHLGAARARA